MNVILLGTLTWALGSSVVPSREVGWAPDNSIVMVTWQFLIAGALAAFGLTRSEDLGALTQVDTRTFVAWLLIVVRSRYGYFTWLLQNAEISLGDATYACDQSASLMFSMVSGGTDGAGFGR